MPMNGRIGWAIAFPPWKHDRRGVPSPQVRGSILCVPSGTRPITNWGVSLWILASGVTSALEEFFPLPPLWGGRARVGGRRPQAIHFPQPSFTRGREKTARAEALLHAQIKRNTQNQLTDAAARLAHMTTSLERKRRCHDSRQEKTYERLSGALYKNGQIILDVPDVLPKGTRVEALPINEALAIASSPCRQRPDHGARVNYRELVHHVTQKLPNNRTT